MIRKSLAVAALLLVAACNKAPEDATAHYTVSGGQVTVTVKANAKGDLRFEAGPQTLIRKDGKDYVVGDNGGEKFAIGVADFIAAQDEFMKSTGAKPQPRPTDPEYESVQVGEETVAGQKGQIWRVQPKGEADAGQSLAIVMSTDPSLANLGKAIVLQANLRSAGIKQLTGSEASSEKNLNQVLAKGMMLRMGDMMMLKDVTKGPIPASDFELPKIIDKATILKRMNDAREQMGKVPAGAAPGAAAPAAPAPAPSASASPAPKAATK